MSKNLIKIYKEYFVKASYYDLNSKHRKISSDITR